MKNSLEKNNSFDGIPKKDWPTTTVIAQLAVQLRDRTDTDWEAIDWAIKLWVEAYWRLDEERSK